MEINLTSGLHQCLHGFFLSCQNILLFVVDWVFLPNNKAPESDKIGISLCSSVGILTIQRYARSLKLWNEVLSNKFQTSLPQK